MCKKAVSILLAALLTLSLAACGNKNEPEAAPQGNEAKSDEQSKDSASGDAKLKMAYIENFASHEFYENICAGAKAEAEDADIELMIADGNGDINKQISLGENYLTQDVDALIVTPADATGITPLVDKAMTDGVPVITESVKADKQTSYIGIDDFEGGRLVGEYAGKYINDNKFKLKKCLLVGLPALEACVNRTEGFKEGLKSVVPDAEFIEIDGQGAKDKAMQVATNALTANPDINLIMGINDDSTLGAIQAYVTQGGDSKDVIAFGFGVEGVAAKNELNDADSPYMGGLGMFPENIGRLLVQTAAKAASGETVQETVQVPFDVLTKENISTYYTKSGDKWEINWDAIETLQK